MLERCNIVTALGRKDAPFLFWVLSKLHDWKDVGQTTFHLKATTLDEAKKIA
jgi:hypothetical protein